ncbi:PREDICTED: limbic system-associated membrane protein-like [Trachymyrmex cornetzi]|uniref:limbic system-associated membrane protein-like n=1 Tax=Trachymyrmex cornetzi TaxID=471704 RepID=UPI00084F515F|nr:PREDICTED: limbic system-associated membrane protein-like [Trachymyrmex cornetzi]
MLLLVWILCMTGVQAATNRDGHPTTVQTYENETVLLPCYVEDAQTRVRWWRDEILLAESSLGQEQQSSERITLYSNGSLRVHHVQREDSGPYVCQAIRPSPWGHVTQVHEIEVMYPPSVETVPEYGELEVDLNEEVIMQCVAKGVPAPIISWRTKGREIPFRDTRAVLRFSADNRNLSGRYTCVASNGIGEPAEAHIDLRIRYKPEIYVKRPWVHAYPGIRVTLDCTVSAWPEAKVEWYFNNKTINYTSRIVKYNTENNYSLLIRYVASNDSGSYTCRASNSMGITEKIIELSQIANPAVFKKESGSASSTSYNFIWVVDSYSSIIQYQFWFRRYMKNGGGEWHKLYIPAGGGEISPVHVRSFNLTGLDAATYYEAVVLSRNRYGWSHPSEILRFHTEGAPVDSSENSEMDGDQEQNRIAVIQLSSMSQHYLLTTDASGSIYNQSQVLSLILSTLCTLIITRDRFN